MKGNRDKRRKIHEIADHTTVKKLFTIALTNQNSMVPLESSFQRWGKHPCDHEHRPRSVISLLK